MRKIRQHNDIDIVVTLKNDEGAVLDATFIKEYKVFLTQVGYRLRIEDYQILPDGRIGFRFHAANQRVGVYSIVVTAVTTDDRVFTTDVCNAFALVRCSCDAEDGSSDAEIEALEVNATFEVTAESDPIFKASPAAKITDEDIESWKAQGTELKNLAKVAKSGSYNDLADKPAIPTESTVGGWGFTKNAGTVTGIKVNGQTKGTSGVVDLGTVITEHQDISGKQDVINDLANIRQGAEKGKALSAELTELSAKVSGGRKDLVSGIDFEYIDGDYRGTGVIDYTASYWHSSPIFLKKGESIYTKRQYRGNTWAFVQVTEDGAWIKGLVKVDQSLEHSYTAAEDMYVSITNTKVNATSYRPLEEAYLIVSGLDVLPSELQELKENTTKAIDGLSASLGQRIDFAKGVDYQQNQGSINKRGILKADDADFWYSTPIAVKRGEVVYMTTPYQGVGMAIGRTDADGNYYAPIAIHDDTKSYVANIDFDGYIAITFIKNYLPTKFYKETSQFAIDKGAAETYADLEIAKKESAEIDYKALEVQHETHFTNLCIQARFERGKMVAELATLTDDDILAQGSCGYTESNGQITDGTIKWRIYKGGLLHISGYGKMYDFVKGTEATKTIAEVNAKVSSLGADFWYYGFVNENVNGIVPPFPQSNQKYNTDEVMNYSNKRYVPFGEDINSLNGKPYGYSAPWYIYRVHVDDAYTSYDLYKAKNPHGITYNRILIEEDASKGGITYIGNWAFYRVSADSLILPSSVTKIGCWGVRYSPVLKTLIMGDNITTIEDHGVSRMEAMEAVKISNKLVSLGYSGMDSDAQLKMVDFPNTTTSLGTFCFNGCGSLQLAKFGSVASMPRNFATLSSLVKADIPSATKVIGMNAFYKTDINRLIIPSNVSNIESNAFRYVDIKAIVIESQSILDKMTIQNAPETTQLQQGACIGRCDYILIPIGLTPSYAIEQLFLYKGEDENYRYYKRNTPKVKLDS